METLTALDAGFLHAEDSDPHVSMAIGAVSIMAGPTPCFDELILHLNKRVQHIPRLTQVLRIHPLDLVAPQWVTDPRFDISRHLYRIALPAPGNDTELFRVIATAMQQRLDRDRPLWECWVIEGLPDNKWAILIKLHHCVADGVGATQMLAKLCDTENRPKATHVQTETGASAPIARSALSLLNPLNWRHSLWDATLAAEHAGVGAVELAAGLLESPSTSSLTGSLTTLRCYSATRVDLAEIRAVSKAFGVTINDVALAAIASGYRELLLSRGEQPRHESLRTLVPVSIRSMKDLHQNGNQVSVLLPLLPVDEPDPIRQLELVHRRTTAAKDSGQRPGGKAILAVADIVPFALSAWTIRLLLRFPQRGISALATNVPGPSNRLHVIGHEVVGILPVPPIALGLRTGVAMVSYADSFVFGITADRDSAPDIDQLASGIKRGVMNLTALAPTRPRRRRRPDTE